MTPGKAIYIIEDDPDFGAYLLELLEDSWSGTANLYADGLEGLRACLADSPTVLVLDLNLPSLRGEEICRLIRSSPSHRSIRILICSDMPEAQRREMELLSLGADVYFPKPFSEQLFIETIEQLAGSSAPTRDSSAPNPEDVEETKESPHKGGTGWELTRMEGAAGTSSQGASAIPTFVGYEILDVLGGGATGTVYRARQEKLDREVALKVFLRNPEDPPEYLERFMREARILAHVTHPGIVQVFDTGHTGYTSYIAMEYMQRGSLMHLIDYREITWTTVRRVIKEAGGALAFLHTREVIHRDIKPGNILVSGDGIIKLGDFGLSRARLPSEKSEFTRTYSLMGTRQYMAPEILQGAQATESTDQYALGRTVLRLFEGKNPVSPPRRLDEFVDSAPVEFADALARTMEPDPRQRFPSVDAACEALAATLPIDDSPT